MYLVPEKDLLSLLTDVHTLNALDFGGVDNWSWYGDSICDYLNGYGQGAEDIEELAECDLANYESIER